jgi:hypothetical protein
MLNYLVAFATGIIVVNLTLTFIGAKKEQKSLIIPAVLFALGAIASKLFLQLPPFMHASIVVSLNAIIIFLLLKIDFLISLIGSLLTFGVFTFGSFLIVCPLLINFGLEIPVTPSNSADWIYLSIAECIIPLTALFVLRITRVSIAKLITTLQEI